MKSNWATNTFEWWSKWIRFEHRRKIRTVFMFEAQRSKPFNSSSEPFRFFNFSKSKIKERRDEVRMDTPEWRVLNIYRFTGLRTKWNKVVGNCLFCFKCCVAATVAFKIGVAPAHHFAVFVWFASCCSRIICILTFIFFWIFIDEYDAQAAGTRAYLRCR